MSALNACRIYKTVLVAMRILLRLCRLRRLEMVLEVLDRLVLLGDDGVNVTLAVVGGCSMATPRRCSALRRS